MAGERSVSPTVRLTNIYGWLGVESEDYRYDSPDDSHDRQRLRTHIDINGRGYVWDPRFATFDTGIALQRERVQSHGTGVNGDTKLNLLGYHLTSTWFANRPFPLSLYASRNQSTVSDFWSPSYEMTTTNLGGRWGLESRRLGRIGFYLDHTSSESNSTDVPRSEKNLSLGADASRKVSSQKWGESDLSYGYRHTAWDEQVYGNKQRQDYFYFNDHTLYGEKTNVTANLTYYDRSDQWGSSGPSSGTMNSKFLAFNSAVAVQQTDSLRYDANLGFSMNDAGGSKSNSMNVSGGANYRLNEHWQTTGMLAMSRSTSETPTRSDTASQNRQSDTVSSTGTVLYSNVFGNYMVNGGYSLSLIRTTTSGSFTDATSQPAQRNTVHTAQLGYTRLNSRLYADSLQLSTSRTTGDPAGSESNIRYSVTSVLTQHDMLQGSLEHRRYKQESTLSSASSGSSGYYDYTMDSRSTRVDFGWLHRFSRTGSATLSGGATKGQSQDLTTESRYVQARAAMRLRALQWTALARTERIKGIASISGRKTTIESDLIYPFGKWETSVRYRLRDAKMDTAPFKEHSITFLLKRNFGFRR